MEVIHWMPLDKSNRSIHGGHRTQIENTVRCLIAFGVNARVEYEHNVEFPPNVIVHTYGVDIAKLSCLRKQNVRIVTSPIYWPTYINDVYAIRAHRIFMRSKHYLSFLRRMLFTLREPELTSFRLGIKYARLAVQYSMVDLLLPNSNLEDIQITHDLGMNFRSMVVPLGVDQTVFYNNNANRDGDLVLCIGRIEPHKNQLGLVKAFTRLPYRLILAGALHPDHPDYCKRVLAQCKGNVSYVGSGDSSFLRDLYNRSSVHVLPSWSETVGLTSLEASFCGNKVVHTQNSFGHDYFGNSVKYCDPSSLSSIRSSISSTMNSPTILPLQQESTAGYTWENSVRMLIEAYSAIC
jgi:glycosyltransferase involved in cell wall biosynthesis